MEYGGMRQASDTAPHGGAARNRRIKTGSRIDLKDMRPTRFANSRGRWGLAPDSDKPTDAPLTFDIGP
jgi:hypothetical protein